MDAREALQAEYEKNLTEIRQFQNREKILLNKQRDAERKARNHRLIEHGAVLESIFPETISMTGEQVKAFLKKIR